MTLAAQLDGLAGFTYGPFANTPTFPFGVACWLLPTNPLRADHNFIWSFNVSSRTDLRGVFAGGIQNTTGNMMVHAGDLASTTVRTVTGVTPPADTWVWCDWWFPDGMTCIFDANFAFALPKTVTYPDMNPVSPIGFNRFCIGKRATANAATNYYEGHIAQLWLHDRELTVPEKDSLRLGRHPEEVCPGTVIAMFDSMGATIGRPMLDNYQLFTLTTISATGITSSALRPPDVSHPANL